MTGTTRGRGRLFRTTVPGDGRESRDRPCQMQLTGRAERAQQRHPGRRAVEGRIKLARWLFQSIGSVDKLTGRSAKGRRTEDRRRVDDTRDAPIVSKLPSDWRSVCM